MQAKRAFQELDQNVEIKKFRQICETSRPQAPKPVRLNYLSNLPPEVQVLIFEHLSQKDLSTLSTVSRASRDIVIYHFLLNKKRLTDTFQAMSTTNEDNSETANDFGLLMKRATFSYPIGERIQLIVKAFEKVRLRDQLRLIYESDKASFKNFVKSIKCVFAKVIRGWKFKEAIKLIGGLELYFDHSKLINRFLREDYSAIRKDEQYLRYFCRKVIFEGLEDNRSRAKWLADFLDHHTNITPDPNIRMTLKGKLLLLLFSPVFQDNLTGVLYVDWLAYSSNFFIDDCLAYLGLAFKLLNSLKDSPKRRLDIVHLFRTVTNIGLYWLNENSSTLLFHCGMKVARQVIDWLLESEDYLYLVRHLTNLFIIEGNLLRLGKINAHERITLPIFDYLKGSMNVLALENILEMISIDFFNIACETERASEEREYLSTVEIVLGQKQFYELLMRKGNTIS